MTNVHLITNQLMKHLHKELEMADTICILTSFLMKSGVELLVQPLRNAAERGADIKICTGDYLFITQPEALKQLHSIHPNIEIRLWKSEGITFHPKAYIFKHNNNDHVFVGSSNLSHSALTSGVEWNVSVSENNTFFENVLEQFTKLMYHEQTIPVNIETIKEYENAYEKYHKKHPNLVRVWTETEELELMLPTEKDREDRSLEIIKETETLYQTKLQPRDAQTLALKELNSTINEGYNRALVIMATGLGKTYLAAFFAERFKRVLFIAHREEILFQAKKTFKHVHPNKTSGIYNGKIKDEQTDFVFASIFTLSMKQHLQRFQREDFDLIVVDEFHHAAAKSYQNVLEYFRPTFLLGLTATPDRNDNKDVYAICKGNVAYRIDFIEAIQKQWLSPFQYYGVYDETDYSQIKWLGNRYDEIELLQTQLREEQAEKIYHAWLKHKQTRTLVFCSSIKQANFLCDYFKKQGERSISLHSQQTEVKRDEAINLLESREIDVIFTVDLFNEGVDIPSVDTLLFVRPTESLTVFIQQIGRGLRLHPEKTHCVVIDLIGNYRNADVKLRVFDTNKDSHKKSKNVLPVVPEGCIIDLETKVINLLEELSRKRQPRKEKLRNDYYALKEEIGRRPTYLEMHLWGKSQPSEYKSEFKSFLKFLYSEDELSPIESEIYKHFENWIIEVETTSMSKSYKMIVLLSMLNRGVNDWFKPITAKEIAPFFHQYLTEKPYRKQIDFSDNESKKLWNYHEERVESLIKRMPMTKWSGSSNGLVSFDGEKFTLTFDVVKKYRDIIFEWTKQICEYRLHAHFERRSNRLN